MIRAVLQFLRAWLSAMRPWRLDNGGPYVTGKREMYREKSGRWI